MVYDIKKMREERGQAVEAMQEISRKLKEDERTIMTSEETEAWDKADTVQEDRRQQIETAERIEKVEELTSSSRDSETTSRPTPFMAKREPTVEDRSMAFRAWGMAQNGNHDKLTEDHYAAAEFCGTNLQQNSYKVHLWKKQAHNLSEYEEITRAQNIGTPGKGGYTVNDGVVQGLERIVSTFGNMRELATVIRTTTGEPLPYVVGSDTSSAIIVGENVDMTNEDINYTRKTLGAYKYSSGVFPVSVELWEDAAIDLESDINSVVITRVLRRQNLDTVSGDGSSKPTGYMTSLYDGTTADATADGTAADDISYDNLIDLEMEVDQHYRQASTWVFNDTTFKALRKLKTTDGMPLWVPSLVAGAPDVLLGHKLSVNSAMPEPTTGLAPIAFGDFSKLTLRDVNEVSYKVLHERWAEAGSIGILVMWRFDSLLLNTSAIAVMKMQ